MWKTCCNHNKANLFEKFRLKWCRNGTNAAEKYEFRQMRIGHYIVRYNTIPVLPPCISNLYDFKNKTDVPNQLGLSIQLLQRCCLFSILILNNRVQYSIII